jgi:hypothetical protein
VSFAEEERRKHKGPGYPDKMSGNGKEGEEVVPQKERRRASKGKLC